MRFPGGSDDTRACVDGTGSAAPGNAHGTPLDKPARKAVLQCVGRYDLSGHVEAMAIDNGAWAYAVQWHPEDNAADNAQQAGLFAKFVEQAKNAPLI